MSEHRPFKRRVFARAKSLATHITGDENALHRLAAGPSSILGVLPGKNGRYWREVSRHMRKTELSAVADAAFRADVGRLGPGSYVLDLGANVGDFTQLLADTGATVEAFEPDPWSFEKLNVRFDGRDNVTLHQAAVGTEDKTLTFFRSTGFDGDTGKDSVVSTTIARPGDVKPAGFEVQCINLISFLEAADRDVDIVKMDIEGAEIELLEHLSSAPVLSRVAKMYVETHGSLYPGHFERISHLRDVYAAMERPIVNFDWR